MPIDLSPGATTKRVIRTAIHRVPLCGCGSPQRMWEYVRAVLRRVADNAATPYYGPDGKANPPRPSCYDAMTEPEMSADFVQFVAHVLSAVDLTEHGSSVAWGWLTGGGKLLLAFLDKYGCDPGSDQKGYVGPKWPKWAQSSNPEIDEFECPPDEWQRLGAQHCEDGEAVVP